MVVFDLTCINGHQFEGWFESLADLEEQIGARMLVCPVCGDANVARRPSTFGLVKSRPPVPASPGQDQASARMASAYDRLRALTQTLEAEFADVGSNFSDEALKIHYGVSPRRNIRGLSTDDQEQMLRKEGVEFFKVPMLVRKTPIS
ncbi:MAG: DUF1178 family protein [Deltaproteobacteria bacterium]|jgi:hypothetical protein|nr:DUF1178 family protein [Deltaproteobacteria bacterium]